MLTAFRGFGVWFGAFIVLLLSCAPSSAQPYGWVEGTRYAPSPGSSSSYYVQYGYTLNGFRPRAYSAYATGNLPTYLTSINYPHIYGVYGDISAPGRLVYGAAPGDFTTAPNIYGVYSPVTNALVAGPVVPDTASTPVRLTATVNVLLPASADLTFEGVRMGQAGDYRRFVTPPLTPGSNYTYDIRATWRENGQEVSRDRRVAIRAGDELTVDLLTPSAEDRGTSILRTQPNR
jgi:uncharacterized protein (TIGR03000 family)